MAIQSPTAQPAGYSALQIALHWLIAVLIAVAFFTHENMGRALESRMEQGQTGLDGATPHTIVGGIAFALILWRLIIRLRRGAPPAEGTPAVAMAAKWGHWLLYALMLAVPALGAMAWYGYVHAAGEAHEVLGKLLVLLALGHAAVALVHHFLLKDGTLARMKRPSD